MKAVTLQEMKNIEEEAIYGIGIPSVVLMETAAMRVSEKCFDIICENKYSKILVFAGKGNNGGDGLAFCRHIYQKSFRLKKTDIEIIFIGDRNKASEQCQCHLKILMNMINKGFPFEIHFIDDEPDFDLENAVYGADVIIDAIIGTGLKYSLRENILKIVSAINKSECPVISVDCPTGINSDDGNILENAVMADFTVAFHLPKVGLLVGDGSVYSGEVIVSDINIPYGIEKNIKTNVITKEEAKDIIPKRLRNGNKGTFGKVFIFAGCNNMPGACVISSKAAYRTGAGLVFSCSVESVCNVVRNHLPEAVTKVLPDKDGFLFGGSVYRDDLKEADAVVVGPGLGKSDGIFDFVKNIIAFSKVPVIIDADALNSLSKDLSIIKNAKTQCIITPHIGEMSRLTGKSADYIKRNIVKTAKDFAEKVNVIVVLKDFRTVIANPDGNVYINTTGSSVLSKGGSGDCLTGIIASLIAQKTDCFYACVLGTYIFGLSGEKIAEKYGEYSPLAGECSDFISFVLKELQ